jgi:hypothetical protein
MNKSLDKNRLRTTFAQSARSRASSLRVRAASPLRMRMFFHGAAIRARCASVREWRASDNVARDCRKVIGFRTEELVFSKTNVTMSY